MSEQLSWFGEKVKEIKNYFELFKKLDTQVKDYDNQDKDLMR